MLEHSFYFIWSNVYLPGQQQDYFGIRIIVQRYMYMSLQGFFIFFAIAGHFGCQVLAGQYMSVPSQDFGCLHHYSKDLENSCLYLETYGCVLIQGFWLFPSLLGISWDTCHCLDNIQQAIIGILITSTIFQSIFEFVSLIGHYMELNGICGPIGALGCLFVNSGATRTLDHFADVACRRLTIFLLWVT